MLVSKLKNELYNYNLDKIGKSYLREMNLNHIAKKPFFDLFYRSPCMAQMLRLAYQDSGIFCRSNRAGGPRGLIRFPTEIERPENSGLQFAVEQIEELKEDGNHITAILSYSDLI
jgi:catalase (peroxidase I)